MSFQTEPPHKHGSPDRTAVLLVNLGTPDAPTAPALRRYLGEFLWDPRVVEIPRPVWWLILNGIILRTRPAKSAAKYATVWRKEGSPLLYWTQRQAKRLTGQLGERGHQVIVRHAMRYGNPSVASALDALKAEGATRILVVPMYPQYSGATSASTHDAVTQWSLGVRRLPEFRHVMRYHDDVGYIAALADRVRRHWQANGRGEKLVMSFHGMPARTLQLGDPYHCECLVTGRLLAQQLGLGAEDWMVTFQSRFGRAKWLEPYTEPTIRQLAAKGVKSVDVICPGFAVDCLETLEEVAMEVRDAFLTSGGQTYQYIPCLNDDDPWIAALCSIVEQHLQGWPTKAGAGVTEADRALGRQRALALGAKD